MSKRPPSAAARPKRSSYRTGVSAESLCVVWLRLKGYAILERRFKTRTGEIDIIARKANTLAFIEVKARPDLATGLEAIDASGRERIARTAAWYMARKPQLAGLSCRFDAMVVTPGRWPHHIREAWVLS